VGTILYRDASLAVGPVAFNAVMMLFGGSWLVLAGLATGELPRWEWRPGGLLAMLYLAVFGSALAYTRTRGCSSGCRPTGSGRSPT